MPFKPRARRSMRRRRSMPRRRRRGGQSTRSIAVRALRATDQERKFLDNVFANNVVDSADATSISLFVLNAVADGVNNFERIGRKMAMRSLYIQLAVELNAAAVLNASYVRMIVVLDRQPNGALPTVPNVLLLPASGNLLTEMLSPNNLNNSKRFVTLWDHRVTFQRNFISGRLVQKYIPLSQSVQFNGTGGTIGNIATNSLILIMIGDVAGGGPQSLFSGTIRLRFVG